MAISAPPQPASSRTRTVWVVVLVVISVVGIGVAAVWGVRGLFGNPVKSTDGNGIATIEGSFEPYDCAGGSTTCVGYVSDGGRTVSVVFPRGCVPTRAAPIRLQGRQDRSRGTATYIALACPSAP